MGAGFKRLAPICFYLFKGEKMTDKKNNEKKEEDTQKDSIAGVYNPPEKDDDWYRETQSERIMEEDEGDHWIWE